MQSTCWYTVIVQLRALHFLSFGQDVISKSEPTDDNKGLGVFRFGCGTMSMLMTCTQLVGYFQSCFTDSLSCLVHGRCWKGGDLCHLASDLHPFYDPEDYKRRREVELKHGRVRGPGIVPTVILGVSQNEGDSKSPSKWFSAVGNHMDFG